MATFTITGTTKIILVDAEAGDSSFTPAEVYSAWKDWVLDGNAQWEPAFAESVGGNDLGGGAALDGYFFLRNDIGWRIRPDARDHTLTVDGNLFGLSAATAIFSPPVADAVVTIRQVLSSRAQLVAGSGSASDVAAAVWAHASGVDVATKMTLVAKILRNRTETNPATGIMTVYDDDGVTPLLTAALYEDVAAATPYDGTAGSNRRNRLV